MTENRQTTKIGGIFLILFVGMFAIVYIMYLNTYLVKGDLAKSKIFKNVMFGITLFFSFLILNICAGSDYSSFIFLFLLISNILIGNQIYKTQWLQSTQEVLWFGQSRYSFLSLYIIFLFIGVCFKVTVLMNQVIYGIIAFILIGEYIVNKRYNAFLAIWNNTHNGYYVKEDTSIIKSDDLSKQQRLRKENVTERKNMILIGYILSLLIPIISVYFYNPDTDLTSNTLSKVDEIAGQLGDQLEDQAQSVFGTTEEIVTDLSEFTDLFFATPAPG